MARPQEGAIPLQQQGAISTGGEKSERSEHGGEAESDVKDV